MDVPMRDSGPVPKDQLRKLADIFMNDMGMSPEEVLSKPEFVEQGITDLKQLEENKMKITKRQLRRIIREAVTENYPDGTGAIQDAFDAGLADGSDGKEGVYPDWVEGNPELEDAYDAGYDEGEMES